MKQILTFTLFLALSLIICSAYLAYPGGTSIGNDYTLFPINDQLRLFYSIHYGTFPLFIPGYVGGQSSSALTLGQLYHPISWLSYAMPGYWSGYALFANTIMRILTLGIAHFALFSLFQRLPVSSWWAFICSFIAVYNLRMLDCFRYGAALESYTGFLFACTALGFLWLHPEKRRYWFILVGSIYWMITGGHAQTAYYAALSVIFFALLMPFIIEAVQSVMWPSPHRLRGYYIHAIAACSLGLLLASAYLIPFYFDFIRSNGERMNNDYFGWAASYSDTPMGVIRNFFQPLRADIHGSFGGSSVMLLAFFIPLLSLRQNNIRFATLVLWGVMVFLLLVSMGPYTPVHHWLWEWVPLFKSLRAPGRIALPVPLLISMLLLFLWPLLKHGHIKTTIFLLLAAISYELFPFLFRYNFSETYFIPINIFFRSDYHIGIELSIYALGIAGLVALSLCCQYRSLFFLSLTCLFVVTQTGLVIRHGIWREISAATTHLSQYNETIAKRPYFHTNEGFGMARRDVSDYSKRITEAPITKTDQYRYLSPPFASFHGYFRYIDQPSQFFSELPASTPPVPLTIEPQQIMGTPREHLPPPPDNALPAQAQVKLTYNSYNHFEFTVTTKQPGFVMFDIPFMPGWLLWRDGHSVPAYRANAHYLAAYVPVGEHRLELRYWSVTQASGILLSAAAMILLAVIYGWNTQKRFVWFGLSTVLVLMLCGLWYYSLYHGQNLKTSYVWQSKA